MYTARDRFDFLPELHGSRFIRSVILGKNFAGLSHFPLSEAAIRFVRTSSAHERAKIFRGGSHLDFTESRAESRREEKDGLEL